MSAATLHREHVPAAAPSAERRALFLHGMLGSGGNLRTLARRFVAERPGWDAWLVDLRGHGASQKGAPGPSLQAAAADVAALSLAGGGPPVGAVIGHSFGGKVALELLRQARQGPAPVAPAHVVTLDSNPGARAPVTDEDGAPAILEMLTALPPLFPSRAAFVDAVVGRGQSRPIAQWLSMNLAAGEGGLRLGLDLDELRALLASYFAADLWPVVEAPPGEAQVHLVIGARSSSYSEADRQRAREAAARQPRVTVDVLDADHWVHSEDPEGTLRVLLARVR